MVTICFNGDLLEYSMPLSTYQVRIAVLKPDRVRILHVFLPRLQFLFLKHSFGSCRRDQKPYRCRTLCFGFSSAEFRHQLTARLMHVGRFFPSARPGSRWLEPCLLSLTFHLGKQKFRIDVASLCVVDQTGRSMLLTMNLHNLPYPLVQ